MEKKNKGSILIIDDEESIRDFLEIMLSKDGYEVSCAENAEAAIEKAGKRRFDVAITDISMPGMNGIELLEKLKQLHHDTAVIIITAHGSTGSAVEAMKLGATDYLTKPFEVEEMRIAVQAAMKSLRLERENRQLRSALGRSFSFENIVGNSPAVQPLFTLIKQVAQTKTNILILGESGTGKELVAHAIHRNGTNPAAPFVVINCAAVPESLFESELFGHKRGAFTGAVQDKSGFFEQADGGTLFLDEVGDIPLSVQVKLLRAIQQKSFRPVGGTEDKTVDVRIISATNKNLEELVQKGTFREDLFYRLNVIQIRVPSLRERKEDIPLLAEHFLRKFSLAMGKPIKSISQAALRILCDYSYPGNVRELENVIERAVALENQSTILPESLPQKLSLHTALPGGAPAKAPSAAAADAGFDLERGVEDFERTHIIQALEKTKGVKKRAAALLGISFRSLRYRIEKYGIEDPNPEESE